MKKSDLDRITDGMAQGGGELSLTDSDGDERAYNLVGAVNELTNILDEMERYGLAYSDLTAEQQEDLGLAQEAIQYYEAELGGLLASFTGDDGAVEDDNGNALVDLPGAATSAASNVDLPGAGGQ